MAMRKRLGRSKSRRMFAKGARAHGKNFKGAPMRGGTRL